MLFCSLVTLLPRKALECKHTANILGIICVDHLLFYCNPTVDFELVRDTIPPEDNPFNFIQKNTGWLVQFGAFDMKQSSMVLIRINNIDRVATPLQYLLISLFLIDESEPACLALIRSSMAQVCAFEFRNDDCLKIKGIFPARCDR